MLLNHILALTQEMEDEKDFGTRIPALRESIKLVHSVNPATVLGEGGISRGERNGDGWVVPL